MNPGLPFEMTKIFAALQIVAFLPFVVVDFFNGSPTWPFWQVVGGTFSVSVVLFAALEYKLNKG